MNDVALVEAARTGDLATVEELLQAGATVNYSDGSALVCASGGGHLAVVERLIAAGADVNLGWKTGFTPIADAAYAGYREVVECLLAAGANPFQRCHDGDGDDALMYAEIGKLQGHHRHRDRAYDTIIERLKTIQSLMALK